MTAKTKELPKEALRRFPHWLWHKAAEEAGTTKKTDTSSYPNTSVKERKAGEMQPKAELGTKTRNNKGCEEGDWTVIHKQETKIFCGYLGRNALI
jgi:hypothetical protein